MSDYIGFTGAAIQALISDRRIQSPDYQEHFELLALFSDEKCEFDYLKRILSISKTKNGITVISKEEEFSKEKNTITFDLSNGIIRPPNGNNLLPCLLKTFRFCIRYWNKHPLNNNEYLPPGSSKAIIFPYPISTGAAFRVTIEREPNKKRLERRFLGSHLLAYKFGTDEGRGLNEEAPLTSFNKSIEAIFSLNTYEENIKHNDTSLSTLKITRLDQNEKRYIDQNNWKHLISDLQKDFINSPLDVASRIEGPAGSGKTLCLILKAINGLESIKKNGGSHKSLFITPTNEIAGKIEDLIKQYSKTDLLSATGSTHIQVMTLQDVCRKQLGDDISEHDFLDIDTTESKNTQLLYLSEIVESKISELQKYEKILSDGFAKFLKTEHCLTIADLVMHEISIVIKGRCDEEIEKYKTSSRPHYGLPIESCQDREFVFSLYNSYRQKLDEIAAFDVDDIVLSTISKLDSPIWRRRRSTAGYDSIFVDEVHLFSFNELSVIHFLTKKPDTAPVSIAIDVSQALGDIAWSDKEFFDAVRSTNNRSKTTLSAVFRSTSAITNLANSITSNGVTLFGNFVNNLSDSSAISTKIEEKIPEYYLCLSTEKMMATAIDIAERERDQNHLLRSDIAFVCFDQILFNSFIEKIQYSNKPISTMTKRADFDSLKSAINKNTFIICMAEHVGGLEFECVILIGADKGRIPPDSQITTLASRLYHNYMAHNKLYVSVTRARNSVYILGEESRGVATPLESAVNSNALSVFKD